MQGAEFIMVSFTAGTHTNVFAVFTGSWCIIYVTDDVSSVWTDHVAVICFSNNVVLLLGRSPSSENCEIMRSSCYTFAIR
jgi:hypothetical protein